MPSAKQTLLQIANGAYRSAEEWKRATGGKVVGCSPMHFPEELVIAAGLLPIVLQESDEPVTAGYAHLYPFMCGFTRSVVDVAVKDKLTLFDAFIFPDTCLQVRNAAGIFRRRLPRVPVELVQMPQDLRGQRVRDDVTAKLRKIRASLEDLAGRKITDSALKEAIALCNRDRAALRQLYSLRRQNPGSLRAREMLRIVQSSMLMPRQEHLELTEELLGDLATEKVTADSNVKLIISGHLCHAPKVDFLDYIEALGGVIVDDDLYTGYRYVATDASLEGDLIVALADKFVDMVVPCPTRSDAVNDLREYLVGVVNKCGAQGVITLVVKSCEPHIFWNSDVAERLAAARIPHLLLETEHEVVSLEGVKTRIQAFIEMIRGGQLGGQVYA